MKKYLELEKHYLVVTEYDGKKLFSLYPSYDRGTDWLAGMRKACASSGRTLLSAGTLTPRVRVGHRVRYLGHHRSSKTGRVAELSGKHAVLDCGKKIRKHKIVEVLGE